MRNVPFGIYRARIKPLKHKFPTLGYKYREWVKAVGCRSLVICPVIGIAFTRYTYNAVLCCTTRNKEGAVGLKY